MAILTRTAILLSATAATMFALGAPSASLAAANVQAAPGNDGTCGGGPTVSAIDQYCEVVPAAGGGHGTGPRTRELSTTLPPRVVYRLMIDRSRGRILTLPAVANRVPLSGSGSAATHADESSLWTTMLLIMAAIAISLSALAAERWRRRRGRPQQPTSALGASPV
jgi:hypothetical protein